MQLKAQQKNKKLKEELREKQEQIDGELETRVANVMANERLDHGRQIKELEKEMYDVNKDLAHVREVSD